MIASQCASLNLLSFLPDAAREVADALLDPDLGGCVPALADGRPMLVNPTAAELDTAVAAAFERASEDEATLFLALVGHGDYADDDFYFLTHDATSPPDSRTAFHLAQRIKELLGRHSLLDGLVILLDTCHAGVAATQAAARWVHIVGQAGKRFEVLTASDDRTAADGCFSRSLAGVLRSGRPELGERLRCPDLKRVISAFCPRQTAVHLAFDGVRTTTKGDQGLWLAVNASEAWRPLLGNPSAAEIERLTDRYRPAPALSMLVGHLLMGVRCVAVTGDAGSGKSTLVAALARPAIAADVVPSKLLHAVLLLTPGQTGEQIAAELARQLRRSVPGFDAAHARYREQPRLDASAFDLDVAGPLRVLTQEWRGGSIRIALDGLDRLDAAESPRLTRALGAVIADPALARVQLVVAARRSPIEADTRVLHLTREEAGLVCAACGTRNPAEEAFCEVCGSFLSWRADSIRTGASEPAPPAQHSRPAGVQPPASGEALCPLCGSGNARTRRFCSRCGSTLAASPGGGPPPPTGSLPARRIADTVRAVRLVAPLLITTAALTLALPEPARWYPAGVGIMTLLCLAGYSLYRRRRRRLAAEPDWQWRPGRPSAAGDDGTAILEHGFRQGHSADVVRAVLRASASHGPLPLTILARASARLGGPGRISELRDALVRLGDDVLRSRAGSPDETVSLSVPAPRQGRVTAHRALLYAIGELAPASEQSRDTPEQRYARAAEAAYLWQLGQREEAVHSLDERPLTVPFENLERWTAWAGKAAVELGDEHPLTLRCRARVAAWTGKSGDPAAAAAAFEELLPVAERVLGADSLTTLGIRHGAAALRDDR